MVHINLSSKSRRLGACLVKQGWVTSGVLGTKGMVASNYNIPIKGNLLF